MKFSGKVGFYFGQRQTKAGVYRPIVEEKVYTGDVYQHNRTFQKEESHQNDNLSLSNRISILSDLYVQNNWNAIRYVIWKGTRWTVTSINVEFPRIVLQIGGVYDGPTPVSSNPL